MRATAIFLVLVLTAMVGVSLGNPLCRTLVRHPELDTDVGITAEQREEMEELFENTEKEIIESRSRMRIKHLEMERLMRSEDPDMREIRKLVNEIGDARSASMLAGIERTIRMKRILGPGQMGRARKAATRMGKGAGGRPGRRAFGEPGRVMGGALGQRVQGPGHHGGGMKGAEGSGMHGMGCQGHMMQGTEGHGKQGKGCPGHMMQGREGHGKQGKGCPGHMMQGSEGHGKEGKGCPGHMMQGSEGHGKQGKGCPGHKMQGTEGHGKEGKGCPGHKMQGSEGQGDSEGDAHRCRQHIRKEPDASGKDAEGSED